MRSPNPTNFPGQNEEEPFFFSKERFPRNL